MDKGVLAGLTRKEFTCVDVQKPDMNTTRWNLTAYSADLYTELGLLLNISSSHSWLLERLNETKSTCTLSGKLKDKVLDSVQVEWNSNWFKKQSIQEVSRLNFLNMGQRKVSKDKWLYSYSLSSRDSTPRILRIQEVMYFSFLFFTSCQQTCRE